MALEDERLELPEYNQEPLGSSVDFIHGVRSPYRILVGSELACPREFGVFPNFLGFVKPTYHELTPEPTHPNDVFIDDWGCQWGRVPVYNCGTITNKIGMGLVYYDDSAGAGSGTVWFNGITGGIPIIAHQLIANDYVDADIDTGTFNVALIARWHLFVKFSGLPALKPFTSTPEVRYKLGTYVPFAGYNLDTSPEGDVLTPYNCEPEFLIYDQQRTPTAFCLLNPLSATDVDYTIVFGDYPLIYADCALRDPWISQETYQGLPLHIGANLNFTDGVTANIMMFYTFVTSYISGSETRPIVNATV